MVSEHLAERRRILQYEKKIAEWFERSQRANWIVEVITGFEA